MEKSYGPEYYLTLEERLNPSQAQTIPRAVVPFALNPAAIVVLDSLFPNNRVTLSIPRWTGVTETTAGPIPPPDIIYVIRRSTRVSTTVPLFFEPYDPLIVTRDKILVAIIWQEVVFARDTDSGDFLSRELNYAAADPERYFTDIGKRWGKCLICRRELKAEKSLERSIGPVCIRYVREAAKRVAKEFPQGEEEPGSECPVESQPTAAPELAVEPSDARLLNPIELQGLKSLNGKLAGYLGIGFQLTGTGELTTAPPPKLRAKLVTSPKTIFVTVLATEADAARSLEGTGAYYNPQTGDYSFPNTPENAATIRSLFTVLSTTPARPGSEVSVNPTARGYEVSNFPYLDREKIKALPGTRWLPDKKAWLVPLNQKSGLEDLLGYSIPHSL